MLAKLVSIGESNSQKDIICEPLALSNSIFFIEPLDMACLDNILFGVAGPLKRRSLEDEEKASEVKLESSLDPVLMVLIIQVTMKTLSVTENNSEIRTPWKS